MQPTTNLVKKEANQAWEDQEICLETCLVTNQKAHRKLNPSFIQSNVPLKSYTMANKAVSKLAETEFALAVLAKVEIKETTKNAKHASARAKLCGKLW